MKIDDVRKLAADAGLSESAIDHAIKRIAVDGNGNVLYPESVSQSIMIASAFKTE